MKKGIIYKFTNTINGKIYIGQTINPKRRFNEHKSAKNADYMLIDAAILKYGFNNFTYEVLLEIPVLNNNDKILLNEKEIEFIFQYNSRIPNGYNILKGGNAMSGCDNPRYGKPITDANRDNLRKSHLGIPNPMKGKHYPLEQKKAMYRKWKESMQNKYKNGYVAQRRNIHMYEGSEYVGVFPNAKEIERKFGINYKRIHYVLKKRCLLDNTYAFMYEKDQKQLEEIMKNKTAKKKPLPRKIRQLDLEGNIVAIYNSVVEAVQQYGEHIREVCKGQRKTAAGFKWEYIN